MPIAIKLDASAVRELIKDPDFKLELQRSVIAEVVRNTLLKDAAQVLKEIVPGVVAEAVAAFKTDQDLVQNFAARIRDLMPSTVPGSWSAPQLSPKAKEILEQGIKDTFAAQMKVTGASLIPLLNQVTERMKEYADGKMPGIVRDAIDRYDEREITRLVEARLAALKAQL